MLSGKEKRSTLIPAVAAWLLCYFILFIYQQNCSYSPYSSTHAVVALLDVLCLLGSFFIVTRYLVPNYLYKKKIAAFIIRLLLLVVVFSNVLQGLAWLWYTAKGSVDPETLPLMWSAFYQVFTAYLIILIGCICFIALRLIMDQWLAQARYTELAKEKAQTELSFLKAQINPHFLFNSINSIFAHIDKNNAMARQIVLKFSDMLRYQLYECNAEKIPFEKELAYLNNYIELQRLRKDETLALRLETEGNMHGFEIAPLLIIPFVENAFKFVSSHDDRENAIEIQLAQQGGVFSFQCLNTKEYSTGRHRFDGSGIGINNVKRRLELLYPGKYGLLINNGSSTFEVVLKIQTA